MKLATVTAGVLTEGDYVSLSHNVFTVGSLLADRATGARHRLHPRAAQVVRLLHHGIEAAAWYEAAQTIGMTADHFAEVVSFLNEIGGLRLRRTVAGGIRVAICRLIGLGRGHMSVSTLRRWPASLMGICRAVSRLLIPLIICTAALDIAAWAALPSNWIIVRYSVICIAVFWLSAVAHELTHACIIRHYRTTAVVVQAGLRLGILHIPLTFTQEVWSAVCGPLVGALVSFGLCGAMFWLHAGYQLLTIGTAIGGLHALSLLPWYGDGKIVWKAVFT